MSRRFRALKLWFVIRNYGVAGLQNYIREHCRLAKRFESLVKADDRFEVCNIVRVCDSFAKIHMARTKSALIRFQMGLVCFRVKGNNDLNKKLLSNINASGKLHMVPASVHGRFVIRFCVCAQDAKDADIDYAWDVITDFATELLEAEIVKEKSGVPLAVLEHSDEEVGQRTHKVEIAELMDLMERVHLPIQKQPSLASIGEVGKLVENENSVQSKPKQKLAKRLSKRQFSFTDTIEFVGMVNTAQDESMNP